MYIPCNFFNKITNKGKNKYFTVFHITFKNLKKFFSTHLSKLIIKFILLQTNNILRNNLIKIRPIPNKSIIKSEEIFSQLFSGR